MRHDSHYVDEISRQSRAIGKTIPISKIHPNPEQPRSEFGDLTDLSNSIREKGVLEPLLVKPIKADGTFMIIAGERRWRASQLAGLEEVPCIELDIDERSVAEIALIENLQRKDLTIWEEADGLAALSEKYGYTHDEIAKQISKSRSTVTELMTIAGLPTQIRERCAASKIDSKSTLLNIARQFDEAAMFEYMDGLASGKPAKKRPAEKQTTAAAKTSAPKRSDAAFEYAGKNFSVKVTFDDANDESRAAILKALKEAFESIRSGGTNA